MRVIYHTIITYFVCCRSNCWEFSLFISPVSHLLTSVSLPSIYVADLIISSFFQSELALKWFIINKRCIPNHMHRVSLQPIFFLRREISAVCDGSEDFRFVAWLPGLWHFLYSPWQYEWLSLDFIVLPIRCPTSIDISKALRYVIILFTESVRVDFIDVTEDN